MLHQLAWCGAEADNLAPYSSVL